MLPVPLVGAATKYAFALTAAVFCTETLCVRVGGAARHRARLHLSPHLSLKQDYDTVPYVENPYHIYGSKGGKPPGL